MEATESDMYAAIDLLIDKLDRQVLKHKEKQSEHRAPAPKPACNSLIWKAGACGFPLFFALARFQYYQGNVELPGFSQPHA